MKFPTLYELEQAADLVYSTMLPSPQLEWPLLSERCDCRVWVKHENHNPTGAFKVRGGLVYVSRLRQREPDITGLVTATRGNHGQSVAFAASRNQLVSVVVVPEGNNPDKNRAMRALARRRWRPFSRKRRLTPGTKLALFSVGAMWIKPFIAKLCQFDVWLTAEYLERKQQAGLGLYARRT